MRLVPAALMGMALGVLACGSQSSRPCAREVQTVVDREALRVHGLSENDDAVQTMNRLQSAVRCAQEQDVETLQTHVFLFRSRLEARGAVEELAALQQRLADVGVTVAADDVTRRAQKAAQTQMSAYAAAMRAAAGADVDVMVRAHLASLGLDPEHQGTFPAVTRALVNHVGPNESCFTVINHRELPTGAAVVSLKRAGNVLPTHGDSPAFGVSKGKPRVVRLCISQPLKTDDLVEIHVAGEKAWEQKLTITPDDEIRGMLRRAVKDEEVTAACKNAKEHSARTACAVLLARGKP